MNVPIRFQYLPLDGGNPDLNKLTSLHKDVVGSDGEQYCLLSYFPEKLRLSEENDFVINKYLLFVIDPNSESNYTTTWSYEITRTSPEGDVNITDDLVREITPRDFECILNLRYLEVVNNAEWELKLKLTCVIDKNGEFERELSLEHKILPIEPSLLSSNYASFEDETGNNSSVGLGSETTTHFLRGHLSEYLTERKGLIHSDTDADLDTNDENPNNASVFVHQTASYIYLNVLQQLQYLSPDLFVSGETTTSSSRLDRIFEAGWLEGAIEGRLPMSGYARVGVCSINLHHAISHFKGEANTRIEFNTDILNYVTEYFNEHQEDFVRLYNLCVFPKSAIELSAGIFQDLFSRFQADASHSNKIYKTFKTSASEQKSTITAWKELVHSELRESSNDGFMKNLITEYYMGFFKEISGKSIRYGKSSRILKIDWSQFIQKLLKPSSVTVPFTLIKIQVRDLRSGKPVRNKLIKRLEFHSSTKKLDPSPTIFKYEIVDPFEDSDVLKSDDSNNKKLQKMLKCMGYFNYARVGGVRLPSDNYTNSLRTAIFNYLKDADRDLTALNIDLPATAANVDDNKDAWINYILDDFNAHCVTSDDGILNCKIPDILLKDRLLNIHVGFSEFAIVLEGLNDNKSIVRIDRPTNMGPQTYEPTNFDATWEGAIGEPNEQNIDWDDTIKNNKNFGWKITEENNGQSDHLRVALSIPLKLYKDVPYNHVKVGAKAEGEEDTSKEDNSHFSKYFSTDEIHFVVYAMQWCQPIWNPIPTTATRMIKGQIDPITGLSGSTHVGIMNTDRNLPKLVSTPTGSGSGKGRDYGTLFPRNRNAVDENGARFNRALNADPAAVVSETFAGTPPRGAGSKHDGIDYLAIEGESPVFALHGAKIHGVAGTQTAQSPSDGYGINRIIRYHKYYFRFAHLNGILTRNAANPDPDVSGLARGEKVLAGTWLGFAGRTYYERGFYSVDNTARNRYYQSGATHLHFEVCHTSTSQRIANPLWIFNNFPDHREENEIVLLNNAEHRLFPCDCHWPAASAHNAAKCAIRSDLGVAVADRLTTKSTSCWASTNLHCPYMNTNNISGPVTPAREAELDTFRVQSQLTYLFEDDGNRNAAGNPLPGGYEDPGDINGVWGRSAQNAIERFRDIHRAILFAQNPPDPPPIVPPAGDPWWTSQPLNGDDTWNLLHTEAPYPRIDLTRVDK